jgi:hypothetical protein
MNFVLGFGLSFFLSVFAIADENGNVIIKPGSCGGSVFSSIMKVCELVDKLGASCKITSDTCVSGQQEVFTGNLIEFAGPGNVKPWNGMGGMGGHYMAATACLMRDLHDLPEQKFSKTATASTFLGDVHVVQDVGFLSFSKETGTFEGYHRLKACGPVVGCLDAYTQKFKMTPVKSIKKGSGLKAGAYEIQEAYALDFWADGLAQGIQVNLPNINVPTPVGPIAVQPEFRFGRATGFLVGPYEGNVKSSFPDKGLGLKANQTVDVYGRNPGSVATARSPIDSNSPEPGWTYRPKGWISQIAIGSRDADPKKAVWTPAPGVEYPVRPDSDITQARSKAEKTPNAYLGASILAEYDIKNILPKALLNLGCSGLVKICLEETRVFARPTIDIGFMSQINIFENEQSVWNGKVKGGGSLPIPDLSPINMDQAKTAAVFAAASTAARFALDAGLDLTIRLKINTVFTKINKLIVNLHPRTTIAEKIDKGYSETKMAAIRSQATKMVNEKRYFQQYLTFKGVNEAANPAVDGGAAHIKACYEKPSATGSMPPEPTYSPGNPEDLIAPMEFMCNICVGWDDIPYKDDAGVEWIEKGQLGVIFPAPQTGFAENVKWSCNRVAKSGCHDMCKLDSAGKLIVIRTAVQMLKAGQTKDMPATCKLRGE